MQATHKLAPDLPHFPSAARRENASLIRECLASASLWGNKALEPIALKGMDQLRIRTPIQLEAKEDG